MSLMTLWMAIKINGVSFKEAVSGITAHGERAERLGHAGREYWSRRPGSRTLWGRFGKWLTHRKERREARRLEREAVRQDPLGLDRL